MTMESSSFNRPLGTTLSAMGGVWRLTMVLADPARIDGTVSGKVAVEVESRTS